MSEEMSVCMPVSMSGPMSEHESGLEKTRQNNHPYVFECNDIITCRNASHHRDRSKSSNQMQSTYLQYYIHICNYMCVCIYLPFTYSLLSLKGINCCRTVTLPSQRPGSTQTDVDSLILWDGIREASSSSRHDKPRQWQPPSHGHCHRTHVRRRRDGYGMCSKSCDKNS